MTYDKLRIVGTDNSDSLHIVDDGANSYIANGDVMVTERTHASDRPIHCSELKKVLKRRNWHKSDTKFIGKDGKLYSRIYTTYGPSGNIDLIETDPKKYNYSGYAYQVSDYFSSLSDEVKKKTISDINQLYEKLFGAMKETEISFYSVPGSVVNILDKSVVFDLIRYDSSEYTDTVSLGEVLKLPMAPVEYCRVDLGVQYTKNGIDPKNGETTAEVHCSETCFTAFSFENEKRVDHNIVGKFNDEVGYECLNGIIKVSPLTNNINECIISYCTITYGRN